MPACPASFDVDALVEVLKAVRKGQPVTVPRSKAAPSSEQSCVGVSKRNMSLINSALAQCLSLFLYHPTICFREAGSGDIVISAPDVLLVKGILVLYDRRVRELLDIKLFVDLDSDSRLSARGAGHGARLGDAPLCLDH